MVGGRCGHAGTWGDGDGGTGTAGSWAGGRGDLVGGGHVLRGQLSVQFDAVQPDLGRAAGLAFILHGCGDKVASGPATLLSSPAVHHRVCVPPTRLTVLVHAGLQALLEPAGLALVAVCLVHWAQPRPRLAPMGRGGTRLQPLGWPLIPEGPVP